MTTYWSGYGWGAVLHPTPTLPSPPILSVQFPTSWRSMWSGSGETLTGGWAVMAYGNAYNWNNCLVLLCMDNIFAICTYNKMGSKDPEINKEMECFWEWCRRRRITIVASYIPGVLIVADEPSRRRAGLWEYTLAKGVFQQLSDWAISSPMTPLTQAPVFDLCATHINAQTSLFVGLYLDPFCITVDCLLLEASTAPPPGAAVGIPTSKNPDSAASESQRRRGDGTPALRSVETHVPTATSRHASATFSNGTLDTVDGARSTLGLQTGGPAGRGATQRPEDLVEVAPLWVRDLWQHCRAHGVQSEVASEHIATLARLLNPATVHA